MDLKVLSDISFTLNQERLRESMNLVSGGEDANRLFELAREAEEIGRPKAMYCTAYVDEHGEDHIVVDGAVLHSRVLRINLERAHRVFPYVATCGRELEEWTDSLPDILERFWADMIMEKAMRAALARLNDDLRKVNPGQASAMNPGSLPDWPLQEQAPLFRLLGDPEREIGVRLTDSYLMLPRKSVSGLRFPSAESFENCQLCPRENCPGRRAPYDSDLYGRRYSRPKRS